MTFPYSASSSVVNQRVILHSSSLARHFDFPLAGTRGAAPTGGAPGASALRTSGNFIADHGDFERRSSYENKIYFFLQFRCVQNSTPEHSLGNHYRCGFSCTVAYNFFFSPPGEGEAGAISQGEQCSLVDNCFDEFSENIR